MRPTRLFSRLLDRAYRIGVENPAKYHQFLTIFSLRCDGISPHVLLRAVFDAFRPGDDAHPGNLAMWWAGRKIRLRRLQLWVGGTPNGDGTYTWHGDQARQLVHYYDLLTLAGRIRFAGAIEKATDPDVASGDTFVSVLRMGDPQDPTLYGPGGAVPEEVKGLDTVVYGIQTWHFSVDGDHVRVVHVSEGSRRAKDAASCVFPSPLVAWAIRLAHDLEMRRGLRSLPDFLTGKMGHEQDQSRMVNGELLGREITLEFEKPRWPAWLDWLAERLTGFAR